MPTKRDKDAVDERIAALEAKKKIATMSKLRRMLSISKTSAGTGSSTASQSSHSGKSGGGTYESLITGLIHKQWIFPDTSDSNLLAIVDIRIARSGNVTVLGFERKSGNTLFDRAAVRAILNASPLPPPIAEMEIGIRFTP